jgi:hypothetical protein
MEANVKMLIAAALAAVALASSANVTLAQYEPDSVPIVRNYLGQLACPSNYVIRGNLCVSIYAGRRRGYDDGDYRGSYDGGYRRGPAVTRPWINNRGQLQCPSNYVLDDANNCVSIYAR